MGNKRQVSGFRLNAVVVCGLWSVVCAVAVLLPTHTWAQDPVDILYTWDGTDMEGWTHASAETSLVNPGGYLQMRFPRQSLPESVSDTTWHTLDTGILVTNVSFRFRAETDTASAVRLSFHSSRSGRIWYVALPNSSPGLWKTYSVNFTFTTGWSYGRGSTAQEFSEDLQAIDWIGVYVRRPVNPVRQRYQIDDFRILGHTMPDWQDSDSDGMPDYWETKYGLNPNDPSDAPTDLDDDGYSNYDEYRAGTDPTDPNSMFTLEIRIKKSAAPTGWVLEWDSLEWRTYSVWRSGDLKQPFTQMASGIPGAPPRNEYVDGTATNTGPYYYRVGIE